MHDLERGKIAVTGGAGLIGSGVIWALNRRGLDDILVVDRLDASEKWRHLVPLRFADYVDADDFAAGTATERTRRHNRDRPPRSLLVDDRARRRLSSCATTSSTRRRSRSGRYPTDARFVYASSAATYGGLESGLSDESDLHSLRPLNMYAYSKHLFDLYAKRKHWDERICGLKYFNVFGPNEDHKGEMRSIVQKAFEQIRETRKRSALQELPPRVPRRRAAARLHLSSKTPSR